MAKLTLASLVLDHKTVNFEFPGYPGFCVDLTYTTAEKYAEIRKSCVTTKLDSATGYPMEILDQEAWNRAFSDQIIAGWSGLTYKILATLILINEDAIEDMEAEVDFDSDNAQMLLKHSPVFDTWVKERMSDLNNFRK